MITDTLLESKERNQVTIDLENFSIDDELSKYEEFELYSYKVLVRLFIGDNTFATIAGRKSSLYLPPNTINQDIYTSCTGLIVKMGCEAFKGKSFEEGIDYPKPGDWVLIPRGEGLQFQYNQISMSLIDDHRLLYARIKNPKLFSK